MSSAVAAGSSIGVSWKHRQETSNHSSYKVKLP
jgi:hypothetical protein